MHPSARLRKPRMLCREVLVGALLLTGCTQVGPDFIRPEAQVRQQWMEADDVQVRTSAADYRMWWSAFRDPVNSTSKGRQIKPLKSPNNHFLPGRWSVPSLVAPRPENSADRTEFVYTKPMVGLTQGNPPFQLDASYTFTTDIRVPLGGRIASFGIYLLKGKPVFCWNLVDLKRIRWECPDELTLGRHTLEFDFKHDGLGLGA